MLFAARSRDTLEALTAPQNHPRALGLACGIGSLGLSCTRSHAGCDVWIARAGLGDTYTPTPAKNIFALWPCPLLLYT